MRAHEQHGHACVGKSACNLIAPAAAAPDVAVVPTIDGPASGIRRKMGSQIFHPFLIAMAIAYHSGVLRRRCRFRSAGLLVNHSSSPESNDVVALIWVPDLLTWLFQIEVFPPLVGLNQVPGRQERHLVDQDMAPITRRV